jgi:hypothetical protein
MVADCNANMLTGTFCAGQFLDAIRGHSLMSGAALQGAFSGQDASIQPQYPINYPINQLEDYNSSHSTNYSLGRSGTIIITPKTQTSNPWMKVHRGAGISDFTGWWPEQTDLNIVLGSDGQWESGGPDVYAAFIAADYSPENAARNENVNAGFTRVENITLLGAYDGFDFSSVDQALSALFMRNLKGYCLNTTLYLTNLPVLSQITDLVFTPAYYAPFNYLWPASPLPAPSNRFLRWAMAHSAAIRIDHRAVGLYMRRLAFRQAKYLFYFSALGPKDLPGVSYPNYPTLPNYPDYSSRPPEITGTYNQLTISEVGVERIPTLLYVAPDAILHNVNFSNVVAHCADPDNRSNAQPCIWIDSIGSQAGFWNGNGDPNSDNEFVTLDQVTGWNAFFRDMRIQETAGPVMKVGVNDAHTYFRWEGGFVHTWSQGDTRVPAFVNREFNSSPDDQQLHVRHG